MYFPKEGFLGFVPTYMQYNLQLKRREQSQPPLLDGLFVGFPTPPLVVVVDGVPTQQCRWGVGVSRHPPLIVVSAPSSCSSFPLFPRRFSPPRRFPSPPHRRRRLAPPPASSSSSPTSSCSSSSSFPPYSSSSYPPTSTSSPFPLLVIVVFPLVITASPLVVVGHPSSLWFRGVIMVSGLRRCFGYHCIFGIWFRPGGGVRDTNGGMGGGIVKMNHDKHRGSYFCDTPNGPPTSWVPPRVSPSPIPPSNDNKPPTSLWKGEGWLWQHPHL